MSDKDKTEGPGTTGHEWDGIKEWNNPLPRWWVWTFYATIIWSIGYMIAYPAIPLINGATPGVLGYSSRAEVAKEIDRFAQMNAPLEKAIVEADLTEIAKNPDLKNFAERGGAAVFRTYCAQCHGSGAAGAKGYPNLLDDDWLWGGDIETIHDTIAHGVRAAGDDDTRYSEMPAFKDILEEEEVDKVVQYVRKISGQEHDAAMAEEGAEIFAENCVACHGEDGKGSRDVGAPNLTDAIWLYGGDPETIKETVMESRFGQMPNWAARLSEAQIREVAYYVHSLGGGE